MKVGSVFLILLWASSLLPGAAFDDAIKRVLTDQVSAWNRGDLKEFVSSYADHCTLVGTTIAETTRAQVLEHYQQKYPSAGARGKLTFSDLKVHQVDGQTAIVTGRFHLDRDKASGGPAGGVFSLVFELIGSKWQIILDHTS